MLQSRRSIALISGLALALATVVGASLSSGCASDDARADDHDGGATSDAATDPAPDAGLSPTAPGENADEAAVGCFDFLDTDDDGALDCDDSDCSRQPLCCVGSSSEACCDASTMSEVSFSACTGTGFAALTECASGATFFGSPAPELREGAMVPFGGERFDSGMVLEGSVDPQVSRLSIFGEIAEGGTCDGCVDAVAFGLTSIAQGSFGSTTLVDPDVALMVSTSQREVRLMIGGAVADSTGIAAVREALAASVDEPITYQLETTPTGLATVWALSRTASTTLFENVPYAPRGPARVVLWGRSTNRALEDSEPASIRAIIVRSSTCDSPSSLVRDELPILPDAVDPWWPRDARPSSASVVVYDEDGSPRSLMAFAYQGRIHLAEGIEGGRFRALRDPTIAANAAVRGSREGWRAEVRDPELVRADGRWEIWFTAVGENGERSIGRALGGSSPTDELATIERMLPSEPGDLTWWDGPSYVEATIGSTTHRYLAARRGSGASSEIVIHEVGAEDGLTARPATTYDGALAEPVSTMAVHRVVPARAAFDADEIAAPALVQYGGVLRLYYAGRRGTRWAIGMLISEDARHWHAGNDGAPVLTGSGEGFDALSVNEPEPVLVGNELRLYYTGSDGLGSGIGRGSHRVPDATSP